MAEIGRALIRKIIRIERRRHAPLGMGTMILASQRQATMCCLTRIWIDTLNEHNTAMTNAHVGGDPGKGFLDVER